MKSHPAYSDSGDSMEALIKEVTHVAVKSLRSGSSEVSKALLTTVVVVKKAKPPTAHATSVDVATSISVFDKKSQSTSRVDPSRSIHPHCRSLLNSYWSMFRFGLSPITQAEAVAVLLAASSAEEPACS